MAAPEPERCAAEMEVGPFIVRCEQRHGHRGPHHSQGYGTWTNLGLPRPASSASPEGNTADA